MLKNIRKKITVVTLFIMCAGSIPMSAYAYTEHTTATSNTTEVYVNGLPVQITAYNIKGYNYFKLRDMAAALRRTGDAFDVGYDASTKSVTINMGKEYTRTGNEFQHPESVIKKNAKVSDQSVLVDGNKAEVEAYLIDGNNYFKLRDLGDSIGFVVGWDNNTKCISITTNPVEFVNKEEPIDLEDNTKEDASQVVVPRDFGTFTLKEDEFILVGDIVPNPNAFGYTCFFPGGVNIHIDGHSSDYAEALRVTERPVSVVRAGDIVASSVGTCQVEIYSMTKDFWYANNWDKVQKYSELTTDGMTYIGTATINVVPK